MGLCIEKKNWEFSHVYLSNILNVVNIVKITQHQNEILKKLKAFWAFFNEILIVKGKTHST